MLQVIYVIISFSFLICYSISTAIGIDFGSEYIKVSIARARKPIEMVENTLSLTKTNFCIAITPFERAFGYEAIVKRSKYSSTTFTRLQEFLGKTIDNPGLKDYMEKYFINYDIIEEPKTRTILFKVNIEKKEYQLSPEELFAMMIKYIKFLSEKYSAAKIEECVITIPCFFGYKERKAIVTAVEIAEMKLIHLVHENTAAAVKHLMDNKQTKSEKYFIYYNMGSSYTQVSLISVNSTYTGTKKDLIENQYISVIEEDYDKDLGGRNFDYSLAKLIIDKYYKETKGVIATEEEYKRKINYVLPTAIKYKEILSANKEILVKILGIEPNMEFQTMVTRDEFINKANIDLERTYNLIERILRNNKENVTLDNIIQIEFIGGAQRVPIVKSYISERLGNYSDKMGNHLNGDNVMALGAGIIASDISGYQFPKKKLYLDKNGYMFDIRLVIENINNLKLDFCTSERNDLDNIAPDCNRKLYKTITIFPKQALLFKEKSISFQHDGDFDVKLYQGNDTEHFLNFQFNTVREKILSRIKKEKTLIDIFNKTRIRLVVSIDKFGMITANAEIVYYIQTYLHMVKDKKGMHQFKYLLSIPNEMAPEAINKELELIKGNKNYTGEEKKKFEKELNRIGDKRESKRTMTISSTLIDTYPKPLEKEQKLAMKQKLKVFDNMDKKKLKFAEKKNKLENMIFSQKEWLLSDEKNRLATVSEIDAIRSSTKDIVEWYDNNSDNASEKEIDEYITKLQESFKVVDNRIKQKEKLKTEINYFYSEIESILKRKEKMIEGKFWIKEYFNNEFTAMIEKIKAWMDEAKIKQEELNEYETPVVTKTEIDEKLKELRAEYRKMKNIPKPIPTDL